MIDCRLPFILCRIDINSTKQSKAIPLTNVHYPPTQFVLFLKEDKFNSYVSVYFVCLSVFLYLFLRLFIRLFVCIFVCLFVFLIRGFSEWCPSPLPAGNSCIRHGSLTDSFDKVSSLSISSCIFSLPINVSPEE